MGDMIRIEHGYQPWQPDDDSLIVDVLARFDIPTAGILAQGGHQYLFWCVEGINEPKNIWAYTLLDDHELSWLDEAQTPEEGFHLMSQLMVGRPVTLALASEREGIRFATSVALQEGSDVPEVTRNLLQEFVSAVDSATEHLRAELGPHRAAM